MSEALDRVVEALEKALGGLRDLSEDLSRETDAGQLRVVRGAVDEHEAQIGALAVSWREYDSRLRALEAKARQDGLMALRGKGQR